MNSLLPWPVLRALSLGLFAIANPSVVRAEPPNILIIVADDLGYADVGFNGGKTISTPNLDRLAATGVNLTNFRATPVCSPTRAGLMTGRWPIRFGMMRAVVPPWSKYGLPAEENTLPELLSTAGYDRRAIIGKWHLGHAKQDYLPLHQGFTHFLGHYNGAIDYFTHEREGEVDWHHDDKTVREEGYSTDLLADEAIRFIKESPPGKPWFVYLPFNAPHTPLEAKEEDLAKYARIRNEKHRTYDAMVDSLDQNIGRVLAAVESQPDADNTLVLFFSDNGGVLEVGSDNSPFRGGKFTVFEGGTRVCAAIRWPAAGLVGGGEFGQRIGYIDVVPTMLAAAGAPVAQNLDGIDVLPALKGKGEIPDRPWFSYIDQAGQPHASVHLGKWKLIVDGEPFANARKPPKRTLYDLSEDTAEKHDVAAEYPEIVEQLSALLNEFGRLQKPGIGNYSEGRKGFKAPKDWIIR